MNCDCIKIIDDKLAEENLALDTMIILSNPVSVTLSLSTHWKDKAKKVRGKKTKNIMVTLCPFCGKSAERNGTKDTKAEQEVGTRKDSDS